MITGKQLDAKRDALAYFIQNASALGSAGGGALPLLPGRLPPGDVLGIGLGVRSTDGMGLAGEEVVRVYVTAKDAVCGVPERFGDLPTDLIEVGDIVASALVPTGQRRGRHRPTSCGVSIGHPKVTGGTLGCRVRRANGTLFILSNNHVLAACNAAFVGDAIVQPGTMDGGTTPYDDIATLAPFRSLDFSGAANEFDAAIAELSNPNDVESDIVDIGPPGKIPVPAVELQSVRKHGRSSGHTVGVIVDVSASIWASYGLRRAWFDDQIAIEGVGAAHFSIQGDSGALIVDAVSLAPVALLFAGSSKGLTFGNPIEPILVHYGVSID